MAGPGQKVQERIAFDDIVTKEKQLHAALGLPDLKQT